MADKPRKSRVRGAQNIKVRETWPYPIPQLDWIDRLNFVRQQIGDRGVAILTGISLEDPSYKTVRRWAAGSRIPQVGTYNVVNTEYARLQKSLEKFRLVNVPEEIRSLIAGKITPRYLSKLNSFLRVIRPYILRKAPAEGLPPNSSATRRMRLPVYIQTMDDSGNAKAPAKQAIALILMLVTDLQLNETHTEVNLIRYIDKPSLVLFKNAIDTWINGLPADQPYKAWVVQGVWFSYAG